MRRLAALAGATTIALSASALLAPTAWSLAPERHSLTYVDAFTTDALCGFPTRFEWVGTGYGTTYTDVDGTFLRQRDRIAETLTVSNPVAGSSVSGSDHYTIEFLAVKGTFTRVGLWFHLNLPGGGVVLRDVGRVVFNEDGDLVFIAGQHQWLSGNLGALCEVLG
jgi:hypothetical protein